MKKKNSRDSRDYFIITSIISALKQIYIFFKITLTIQNKKIYIFIIIFNGLHFFVLFQMISYKFSVRKNSIKVISSIMETLYYQLSTAYSISSFDAPSISQLA
jgi:hypothetical protein